MEYQYQLARKGKHVCPRCHQKTFVWYVNDAGIPLDSCVGRCDRENNCGYHMPPREFLKMQGVEIGARNVPAYHGFKERPAIKLKQSYFESDYLKKSMASYEKNHLVSFMLKVFDETKVSKVVSDYYVGTANHFGGGASVFWQVDRNGRIHAGKIMQYDQATGKRIKKPFNQVTWAHSVLKLEEFNLKQCLFGEHLINKLPDDQLVLIVESEKTALIMSCIMEDGICLATGGSHNISNELFLPLRGRDVVFIPDNMKYSEWLNLADSLKHIFRRVGVSDVMERKAIHEGDDIGDIVLDTLMDSVKLDALVSGIVTWHDILM